VFINATKSHVFLGWTNPTGDFQFQQVSLSLEGAEHGYLNIMNGQSLVLYGHPTSSDVEFMLSKSQKMSFDSLSSPSSTRSDAESAPPDGEQLFDRICSEYAEWVVRAGKQLPPEWSMPDLVRTVIGDEAIHIPGFLKDSYYDLMLHGQNAWLCEQIFDFLDLINYVL
jgi:hypothetical protein